jgi:hypothetical protein
MFTSLHQSTDQMLFTKNLYRPYALNYFATRVGHWGLRGDPYLWDELERSMATITPPSTADDLEQLLNEQFKRLTGKSAQRGRHIFVAKYDTGGMSSGTVSSDFWLDEGFPQIIQNYLNLQRSVTAITGLTPEAELAISRCALRFDGYAYIDAQPLMKMHIPVTLADLLYKAQHSGRFSTNPTKNFASNFYLHRCFHGNGTLPAQFSPTWYDMVLYYLHLYRLPTPATYRHASSVDWEKRPKGTAERAAAEIRLLLRFHR